MSTEAEAEVEALAQDTTGAVPEQRRTVNVDGWLKVIVGCVFVGVGLFLVIDTLTTKLVYNGFLSFISWIGEHPVKGFIVLILVDIVATVFFISGFLLTIGAGFAFASAFGIKVGVALATLAIFIGCSIGSIICFLLARYVFRDSVEWLAENSKLFRAINKALDRHGLKINVLLRLTVLIPFNLLDYLMGISSVSITTYAIALTAILPGTIIYSYIGATASSIAEASSLTGWKIGILIFGVIFSLFAIFLASYYAKVELDRIIAEEEEIERQALNQASDPQEETAAALKEGEEPPSSERSLWYKWW